MQERLGGKKEGKKEGIYKRRIWFGCHGSINNGTRVKMGNEQALCIIDLFSGEALKNRRLH